LGTKVEGNGLTIAHAECTIDHGINKTSLWIRGKTSYPLDKLSASTERNFGGDVAEIGANDGFQTYGAGTFKYTVILANKAQSDLCPRAVVVQSDNGALAAWPVEPVVK